MPPPTIGGKGIMFFGSSARPCVRPSINLHFARPYFRDFSETPQIFITWVQGTGGKVSRSEVKDQGRDQDI